MNFEAIKNKLADAFAATQNLELQPTKHNVDLLSTIMNSLSEAFNGIESMEKDAAEKEETKEESDAS